MEYFTHPENKVTYIFNSGATGFCLYLLYCQYVSWAKIVIFMTNL